jgi:hypothetical protein
VEFEDIVLYADTVKFEKNLQVREKTQHFDQQLLTDTHHIHKLRGCPSESECKHIQYMEQKSET